MGTLYTAGSGRLQQLRGGGEGRGRAVLSAWEHWEGEQAHRTRAVLLPQRMAPWDHLACIACRCIPAEHHNPYGLCMHGAQE